MTTRSNTDGRPALRLEDFDPDGRFEAPDIDAMAYYTGRRIVRSAPPAGCLLPRPVEDRPKPEEQRP